jgi:hypothetical protein
MGSQREKRRLGDRVPGCRPKRDDPAVVPIPLRAARLVDHDRPAVGLVGGSAEPVQNVTVVSPTERQQILKPIRHLLPTPLQVVQRPHRLLPLVFQLDGRVGRDRLKDVHEVIESARSVGLDERL